MQTRGVADFPRLNRSGLVRTQLVPEWSDNVCSLTSGNWSHNKEYEWDERQFVTCTGGNEMDGDPE